MIAFESEGSQSDKNCLKPLGLPKIGVFSFSFALWIFVAQKQTL